MSAEPLAIGDTLAKVSAAGYGNSGVAAKVFVVTYLPDIFCHTERKIAILTTPLMHTITDGFEVSSI